MTVRVQEALHADNWRLSTARICLFHGCHIADPDKLCSSSSFGFATLSL
jgi:hypothetical protein